MKRLLQSILATRDPNGTHRRKRKRRRSHITEMAQKNSSRVKAKTAVVVGETSEGNGEKESV